MNLEAERAALLRGILEQPDDDTARLVYADWLQENDEPERAEFIRTMISTGVVLHATGGPCQWVIEGTYPESLAFWRAAGLLSDEKIQQPYTVARGFVSHLEWSCEAFLMHREVIFRTHPVTSIKLTNFTPCTVGMASPELPVVRINNVPTLRNCPDTNATYFPAACKQHLKGGTKLNEYGDRRYHSAVATVAAAHSMCVAYGRKLAGLPPLPSPAPAPAPAPEPQPSSSPSTVPPVNT